MALWKAIQEQAASWTVTSAFERFAAQLPRNAHQRSTGLPGVLQRLDAGGGAVGSRPLRLGTSVPPDLLEKLPGPVPAELGKEPEPEDLSEEFMLWLDGARRVAWAHLDTVAWVRSRLPGYPSMPTPQLAPGTPLTTLEFTWRLIWTPNERARGLQFRAAPPEAGTLLLATEDQRRHLDDTARSLAAAFQRTEEWDRLSTATAALDSYARANLRDARAKLRQRLVDTEVTAHAPNLPRDRDQYRQLVMAEKLEALAGTAREYVDAFAAADQLVETAASDIFGQLATYGELSTLSQPEDLDLYPGNPQAVAFTLPDASWSTEVGMVAWVDDPLIRDAVHITSVTVNLDHATGMVQRMTGVVLAGTAAAWRSTA